MNNQFNSFKKPTKQDWLEKVAADLRGTPLEELDMILSENIRISPFAHPGDLPSPPKSIVQQKSNNSWDIGVPIKVSDPHLANQRALENLQQGASALFFKWQRMPTLEELSTSLADIQLEWISTHFQVPEQGWRSFADLFAAVVQQKGQSSDKIRCSFETAKAGHLLSEDLKYISDTIPRWPATKFITINSRISFSRKEKVVEALAETLYRANRVLCLSGANRLDIGPLSSTIQFSIGLSDSYLVNIAVLRALRLLWQQILDAWNDGDTTPATIAAHIEEGDKDYDVHYNIRATTRAMAAVTGGADRLFIHPPDAKHANNDPTLSRRMTLNIQHVLQQESYFDRVVDPAAGSYCIELLTERVAEAAWKLFQTKTKNEKNTHSQPG